MKRKPRKIWIDRVFKEINNIQHTLQNKLNMDSLTKEDIDIVIEKLHNHYSAIDNLKMSFSPRTFFTGYIDK